VNWAIFVRFNHEISLVNYARPNQEIDFVRYNREFVITVIVITEFDCMNSKSVLFVSLRSDINLIIRAFTCSNYIKLKKLGE
jgi:hypothetical protein